MHQYETRPENHVFTQLEEEDSLLNVVKFYENDIEGEPNHFKYLKVSGGKGGGEYAAKSERARARQPQGQ